MEAVQKWLEGITNISDEEIIAINEIAETEFVKSNVVIIKKGDIADKIGLLVKGAIRTYFTDNNGNDKIVAFVFEGEPLIVFDSFISQIPSSVTSVTMEPSIIIWTDHKRFNSFIIKFPKFNTLLISELAKWFADGKYRMEYLHQNSAKAKYEKMCELKPKINERVPLKYIASYLGITQETLSRIRGKK